jgi:small GTP-binding protein
MSIEPKRAYKIVLIGDPEVGKTSIRRKYMGKSFRADYLKTLGADFAAQKVNVEGESVLLTIWDLAGQSIFHGMRSSFYHGCKCALVVFDVTNPKTLEHCFKWTEEAVNYAKNSIKEIYLVNDRLIQPQDIEKIAQQFREVFNLPVEIYETSALTGANINELFEQMSRKLIIGDEIKEEKWEMKTEEERLSIKTGEAVKDKTEKIQQIKTILEDLETQVAKINQNINGLKKFIRDELE